MQIGKVIAVSSSNAKAARVSVQHGECSIVGWDYFNTEKSVGEEVDYKGWIVKGSVKKPAMNAETGRQKVDENNVPLFFSAIVREVAM